MTARLLCAVPVPPLVAQRASAEFAAILSQERELSLAEMAEAMHKAPDLVALLVSTRTRLDAAAIAQLPSQLKIIATCSVGSEHIDLAAARARGLIVTNTPDVLTDATADLAMMLLLCAARRARDYAQIMDRGWRERFGLGDMLGLDVAGGTLGILGMGRIGQAFARRARGFGMRVLYHNRQRLPPELEQGAEYFAELGAMLPHCQFLSIHAPADGSTRRIIDHEMLQRLPRQAVLVNTARGQLIDEDALVAALASGHLAAAGLDVFCHEPDFDLRLQALPNVFLTPHMGSATIGARNAMGLRCLENIGAFLRGEAPRDRLE